MWRTRLSPGPHAFILWIVVAALLLYAYRFVTAVQVGVSQDDAQYLTLAKSFVQGSPYRLVNFPDQPLGTTFPPGYPLFILAPLWLIVGPNYDLLRLSSLALGLANIGLVYILFRKYLSPRPLAWLVALFALNSFVAHYVGLALSDTAFLFFSLVFIILFERWTSQPTYSLWDTLGVVLVLYMTMLVRYQGAALAVAAVLYLLLYGRRRQAAYLSLGLAVGVSAWWLFLVSNGVSSPGEMHSVQIIETSVSTLVENTLISLVNYWHTIPYVVVPLFGPKLTRLLSGMGLTWVIEVFQAIVLLLILAGLLQSLKKRQFVGFYYVVYVLLIIALTNRYTSEIFDEPRYITVMTPITYYLLMTGADWLIQRVSSHQARLRSLYPIAGALLLALLIARNVVDVRTEFRVPDLSTAQTWIDNNVPESAVIMTPDPIGRALYLHRHTLAFPYAGNGDDLLAEIGEKKPDVLMLTAPLTIDNAPNTECEWDDYLEKVVLPTMNSKPDCFRLIFEDKQTRTLLYCVHQECLQ